MERNSDGKLKQPTEYAIRLKTNNPAYETCIRSKISYLGNPIHRLFIAFGKICHYISIQAKDKLTSLMLTKNNHNSQHSNFKSLATFSKSNFQHTFTKLTLIKTFQLMIRKNILVGIKTFQLMILKLFSSRADSLLVGFRLN